MSRRGGRVDGGEEGERRDWGRRGGQSRALLLEEVATPVGVGAEARARHTDIHGLRTLTAGLVAMGRGESKKSADDGRTGKAYRSSRCFDLSSSAEWKMMS